MYTTENKHLLQLQEGMKNRMKRYMQQPLPLFITSIILAALLLSIFIFFGASATTRGPIEIVLALLLGAIALLVRAVTRGSEEERIVKRAVRKRRHKTKR